MLIVTMVIYPWNLRFFLWLDVFVQQLTSPSLIIMYIAPSLQYMSCMLCDNCYIVLFILPCVKVMNILKYLFPVPKEDSKRVVTFANQDDYISFR